MPRVEQVHRFGDALPPPLRDSSGAVDPAQVRASIELGQGVEERRCRRIRVKSRSDVRGQVSALWPFWRDVDGDDVADDKGMGAEPGWTEGEPESVASWCDESTDG